MSGVTEMTQTTMTVSEIRRALTAMIAQGSSMSTFDGKKQMAYDKAQIYRRLCRADAVGRISKTDRSIVDGIIADLNRDGVLAGELNGYPLIVVRDKF